MPFCLGEVWERREGTGSESKKERKRLSAVLRGRSIFGCASAPAATPVDSYLRTVQS